MSELYQANRNFTCGIYFKKRNIKFWNYQRFCFSKI